MTNHSAGPSSIKSTSTLLHYFFLDVHPSLLHLPFFIDFLRKKTPFRLITASGPNGIIIMSTSARRRLMRDFKVCHYTSQHQLDKTMETWAIPLNCEPLFHFQWPDAWDMVWKLLVSPCSFCLGLIVSRIPLYQRSRPSSPTLTFPFSLAHANRSPGWCFCLPRCR